jgi:hypothetical protein
MRPKLLALVTDPTTPNTTIVQMLDGNNQIQFGSIPTDKLTLWLNENTTLTLAREAVAA